jgi:hypothetical protein
MVVAAVLVVAATGCERGPREKLLEAKTNLQQESKLQETEQLLNDVLENDESNLEAERLLAEVYQLRGEYKRAEEQLEQIWQRHNFDDERADRSADLKSTRELLRTQFVTLYTDWAENLDPTQQPEKFAAVVRRGLQYDPKEMRLNEMLVDFYWNRGQRLVEQDKKQAAAETFDKIQDLRTRRGDDRRQRAEKKARELRLEFFKDEGRRRFKQEGIDTIAGLDGLTVSEDGETIVIDLEQEVDYRLEPDNEDDAKKARQMAFIGLVEQLRALTIDIAGLPDDAQISEIGNERATDILTSDVEFEKRNFRPGRFIIKGSLSVDQAIEMAYDLKLAWEQRRREEDDKEAGSSGRQPDAGRSSDGDAAP